jgi:hypothetical protein
MSLTISKLGASFTIMPQTFEKADVNVYSVAADLQTKEPAFDEYEIVLKELPKTNIFSIPFTTKDLVFYYQPPLTQELDPREYDVITETEAYRKGVRVVYRPENVVGSYAVFHSSKSGNEAGTGKLFHIYRSEAWDAKGNSVWCDMKIADGAIVVIVPQKFLDNAVYPVVVDPTFGYTSIGGTESSQTNVVGTIYLLSEDATITDMHVYTGAGGTGNINCAIFAESDGSLVFSDSVGQAQTSGGWTDFSGLSVGLVSGNYFLVAQATDWKVHYDTIGYDTGVWYDFSSNPNFPASLPTHGHMSWDVSIYATYTLGSTYSPKTRSSLPQTMVTMLNSKMFFS